MATKRTPKELAKFLSYVLGRRPDEFGLVTEADGFVKTKELLKAVNEEEGWGYVRKGHIDEVAVSLPDSPIEIRNDSVRAVNREKLSERLSPEDMPKILFASVKRKTYAHVLEKGIQPGGVLQVTLSSEKEIAERMGKRRDHEPIILSVNVKHAEEKGVVFRRSGETLFTAPEIPVGCFTGPPPPKQKPEKVRIGKKDEAESRKTPGSFMMEFPAQTGKQKRHTTKKRRKEISWKEERKKMKREKHKSWRE